MTLKPLYIVLIVVAVIIVLLAILYFLGKKLEKKQAELATKEIETESVFGFSSISEIQAYESNVVDDIKLERDSSGNWSCSTYENIKLYTAGINTALSSVRSCMAAVVYQGEITDEVIKNYEISRTQHIKVTLKDGTVYTLRFGMQKPGEAMYFAGVEQKGNVYLINSTYKNAATLTKENLLYTQIFDFNDKGKIKNVEVHKKGEMFMSLTSKFTEDSRTWTMNYPLERPCDDSYVEEVISSVTSIFTSEYIEGDCEDLSKYGLDNPAYYLKLTDNKGKGLYIRDLTSTFMFSTQHYTDEDLWQTKYIHELKNIRRPEVVLHIDVAMRGLGNASCGPGPLPKYEMPKGPFTSSFVIMPAK